MEFIVGVALALLLCGAAWVLGMDRDRVFYPNVLIVTASYYVLFAVIDGMVSWTFSTTISCTTPVCRSGFRSFVWRSI